MSTYTIDFKGDGYDKDRKNRLEQGLLIHLPRMMGSMGLRSALAHQFRSCFLIDILKDKTSYG